MKELLIGAKIESIVRQRRMSIVDFADKICCKRENVYNIFKRNSIDIAQLVRISEVLEYNFFKDIANDYDLAKPVDGDEYQCKAVGQFMSVVPKLLEEYNNKSNIVSCPINVEEGEVKIPMPDFIIDPWFILITIGESFEHRCKKCGFNHFEFTTIEDNTGASVVLCDDKIEQRQSINIILDYKTREEWRDTLELAFVTADKYYNEATKFSIKSAIGY